MADKTGKNGSGCNFQRHCHWAIFLGIGFKFNEFILRTAGIIIYPSPGEVRVADWVSLNRSTA